MKRLTVLAILLCFCLLLEEGEGLFGRRRRRRRRRTAQPCDSGPCVRGSCTNTGGTYTCNCPTGWSGSTCNVDVNECSTSRCTHGSCTNTAGSYYCTCEQGWQGSACNTDIDECTHSNPCQHGRCHNTAGGYLCICGEGYYGLHCESACMENCARCSNGFMCNVCNEGYEMEEYLCIDANECIDTPYPCIHGTCSNEEGGYRCHCAQGYEGTWCETDTNECQSNPGICNHGECVNTPGGYECQCDVGWERAQCNRDINECSRYHPCVHGRCMNSEGSYSCMCAPGYQGRHCADDVNECVVDNPCGAHGTCNNIEGSYVCVCHSGYQGVNCTEDKNECDTDPCIHGLCYNDIGTFHCTCEAGWEGERCDIDADECSGLPCIYGNCTNTPGDYQCVCDFGFTGRNCSSDCMPDCEACEDDFTCSDCSAGYYFDVEICKDVDECDDSPCNNGICENHANGYTCVCESGWTGTLCDTDIDDCGDGACLHGECIDGVGSYQCQCHTGYRGENCDVDVDECSTIAPCIHGTCIDVDGGYMCNCTATGYQGLNCSQDIVECDNHPCMYGECTNTIGSYSCQCDGGFTGHNCDVDIDECEDLKPCEHGTCRDYAGGYECECEPGWTGIDCDQDIKECDIDGLCNEGRCYDHPPGGYTCDCGGRYNGTHCEYDRNECLGSACENGECINLKGSYRCDCNTGYFGSRRCIPYPRARLYDHGYDHDPWAINMHGPDIWQYKCVRLREGEMFDINCRRFDRVCVSPHGYISLGGPDRGFANPQPLSHQRSRYIIAALHTLNQGSPWDPYDSNVWISKYSKFDGKQTTVDMFDRIQNEINQLDPSANLPRYFEPKFALIVTYNQMRTYPFREDKPKNTFQITLVSDTATGTSLAIIKYEELESRLEIPNTAGIQIPGSRNKTKLQRGAGTKNIFYLHILPGNPSNHARMDQAGEYFYLTNQPKECPVRHWVNPYLCLKSSHEFWKVTLAVWHRSPRCFCNRFSSLVRGRFVHRGACAYRNFYSQGKLYIKECCFRRAPRWPTFKRWWRFRDLLHSNTVYEAGGRNHLRDMRRFCCASSRDSCNLYKRIRDWTASRRYCRGMTCREIRWANGDPHIVTWDGTQYSFQGVGEYVYAQSELFSIQARMTEYQKADGEGVRASVISAVVMKATNSSTVQVEANGAGLIISSHPPHPTTPDLTQWFIEADDMDSLTYPGDLIMLIKLEQDLAVKFVEAETELSIQAGGFGDLSISLTTTEEEPGFSTVGLMGQINGDPSDDLTTPENVTLPANSTEETIYWGLGQKWLVNLNNTPASMFIYPAGMTSANFTTPPGYEPRFHLLASQTEERRAEIDLACGNSVACSYDLAATENEEFAEKRQVFEQLIANTWEMSNAVQPHILTLSQVNATVGEEVEFTVTVEGAANDTFEFLTDLPDDAEFIVNDTVGTVIWTPQSRDPVYGLPFGGAGSNGYPAYMKTVSVLLCDCSGHGECDFDFIQNVEFDNDTFALAQCDCHRGYAGDFCEEETDACIDDPCVPGSQCTDMSAEEEQATGRAFTCTACPQGYQQLDGFCVEIDECEEAEAQHITLCNPSENSQCHNLIGSYECTCNSGYMMTAIPNTCADKNECQLHEHACTQLCINTEGSYRCGCAEHYVLQEDGKTCLIDENALTPCLENMLCSDYCADASQCGCRLGMSLIDQFTCTYDQECVLGTHGCGANSECIYNFPGYSCKCVAGFKLNDDSRTCTECKPGFWGIECEELCSCATAATLCLPDTGCVECPTGWTGGSCTEDINECNNNPTLCGEYGNCTNSLGTYRCECDHGYEWNVGENDCTYINYCLLLTEADDEPCYNGGVCEHNVGGFTCACATGYEGERCEIETDECASSPCLNDAYCQDQVGSYTCICPQGFTGENCEEDIDECASNPCLNEGLCADQPGSYDCHCPYPWSEFRCIELDACHSNPCANSGTCIDLPGTYRCVCASGWEGDRCEIDINECALHTDECSQICTNTDGFYECSCRYRYELAEDLTSCIADDICVPNAVFCDEDQGYCIDGRSCGCNHGYSLMEDNACVDTDECAINTHRCDEHGDCINEIGGYRCRCHEGYALQNNQRTCQMIDWCVEPTPVNKCLPEAQCVPEVGGFRCVCLPGLTGEYCEIDINNCESNPCYNGAYCEDGRRDSVFCSCRSGFYGEMCDGDYDECISNPCQNEGKCEDLPGGYTCLCIQGFTGANCENDLRECDYSPCVHGTCIDMVGGYQCSCDQLYGGRHCDQEPCASNPCRRNGLCYIEGGENNEYKCECGALYDGDNCEIELDMESLPTTVKTMFTKVSGKFDEELKNRSSTKYREFTYMSKLALKTVLLQYFANDFVDVRNFEYDVGSINIVYDIILLHNTTITAEVIVDTMQYVVNKNGGVLPGMEEYPVLHVEKYDARESEFDIVAITVGLAVAALLAVCCIISARFLWKNKRNRLGSTTFVNVDPVDGNADNRGTPLPCDARPDSRGSVTHSISDINFEESSNSSPLTLAG